MSGFRASVIVPAYNAGRFLADALDSALGQTLPPHEVIVIDDGSTDDTAAVAARFAGRIMYHRQANAGVSAARNAALDRATGDWLAFLDADDIWAPTKLERVAPLCLGSPRPAVVFSDYHTFGGESALCRPSAALAAWDASADVLVPCVGVMPSAALVPAGLGLRFPEWARNDEDAIFFNEASERGPVRCVPEPLVRYRKHAAQAQAHVIAKPIGCENLLRWAKARDPDTARRLFHTLAGLAVAARWKRDWPQYQMLRTFCAEHWPPGVPRPPVLGERVWPRAVYAVKDVLDRALGKRGRPA